MSTHLVIYLSGTSACLRACSPSRWSTLQRITEPVMEVSVP